MADEKDTQPPSPNEAPSPASPDAPDKPAEKPAGPTVGLGGCLTGFVVGGVVLFGGNAVVGLIGLHGAWLTTIEIGLMGLALGATLFVWKVAATADELARERDAAGEDAESESETDPP